MFGWLDWDGHNGVTWTTMEDEGVFENFFFFQFCWENVLLLVEQKKNYTHFKDIRENDLQMEEVLVIISAFSQQKYRADYETKY